MTSDVEHELALAKEELRRLRNLDARTHVIRDTNYLHPSFRQIAKTIEARLARDYQHGKTKTQFKVFETYRDVRRQEYLFHYGNGVTKARGWESAHNFGFAVDFVPWHEGQWSWANEHDYEHLAFVATLAGARVPIKWDRVHVESLAWPGIREAMN